MTFNWTKKPILMGWLPCEVTRLIWETYHKLHVMPELQSNHRFLKQHKVIKQQGKYEETLNKYVDCVNKIYNENECYFYICYEFVEDRILTDEWFVCDDQQYSLIVLGKTKEHVAIKNELRMEIHKLYLGTIHLKPMINNLIMLTRLFES